MEPPTATEIMVGSEALKDLERRDAMYKMATFLVGHFWGKPREMADGLGVLLLTWNQAFYRYGCFDFKDLEECISKNLRTLEGFRERDISTYAASDDAAIKGLFGDFLGALEARRQKPGSRMKSPVATAKALHLLAPEFFPIWDQKIAQAYGCDYSSRPAERYLLFMRKMQSLVTALGFAKSSAPSDKTALKVVDEYNYSRFTKGWI